MDDPPATPAYPLFMTTPIDEAYASLRAKALAAIDELPSGVLLTADLPEVRQRLVATYRFGLLELQWDHPAAREADEGSSVRVLVPFTGAGGLFDMRPTRDDGERPVGWVSEQHLVLVLPADRATAPREFDRQKALVTDWVSRINGDVGILNKELARIIRAAVTFRARRLRDTAALARELGPPPLTRARHAAGDPRRTRVAHGEDPRIAAVPESLPGRPRASHDFNLERYQEALEATPEPRTQAAVAARFRRMDGHVGVDPRHLRRIRRGIADTSR